MKYYVMAPDALGHRAVVCERDGVPTNLQGSQTVELPHNTGILTVVSRGKSYPDYKVALAVAMRQIPLEDVT